MNMNQYIHGVIYFIKLVQMFLRYNFMEKRVHELKEIMSPSSKFPCAIEIKFENNYQIIEFFNNKHSCCLDLKPFEEMNCFVWYLHHAYELRTNLFVINLQVYRELPNIYATQYPPLLFIIHMVRCTKMVLGDHSTSYDHK